MKPIITKGKIIELFKAIFEAIVVWSQFWDCTIYLEVLWVRIWPSILFDFLNFSIFIFNTFFFSN
jgi:hypothetical protein